MAKKLLLGCGLPLVILIILISVSVKTLLKAQPKSERSETAQQGNVEIKVVETGTIEPLRKVETKSKAGGRVLKLWVEEGAVVKKGQIIATIDPQEVNSEVDALRAQLAGAEARLAAAKKSADYQKSQTSSGVSQYEQNVASAKAHLLQLENESRVQPELTRQSIAIAQANLDAANATLKAQQESLNLLIESTHPNNVVSAQAAYDQALAQAANDQHNVERQKQLLGKGFVSQQAVDTAETTANVSASHLREVKDKLTRIKQTNAIEEANARAQVASALGQVRQMEAALGQAQTSVEPMSKQRELESAKAAYGQAVAQLASARSSHKQDGMRMDEAISAAAEVTQIQNQLREKLVQQNDTTLYASMDGVVTKKYTEEGELITSAISSFSSGTPVYQISDLGTLLVKINVNEVDIAKVKVGTLTEVTIDAARGVTFLGKVRRVAPAAGSGSTSTDSSSTSSSSGGSASVIRFAVEIQIDHADTRLKPGMSARCTIVVARHTNVLRIPTNCVTGEGDTGTVQIVTSSQKDGQTVETTTPRTVKLGLRGDDYVEVVSGLRAGEKVRPGAYTGPARKTIDMNGGPD